MNISILTLFPDLFKPFVSTSLLGKAQEKGVVSYDIIDYFSQSKPKERIDAPTFGHGAGMLIKPEIAEKTIEEAERKHGAAFKIFFSPHGKTLDQFMLRDLAKRIAEHKHLMLVTARYEGMDARVEEHYADEIVSVGNFVVMGGDVPAMLFLEGLLRYIPGVVGKETSVEADSFTGPFVDYPEYAAPVEWKGMTVPEVLRSGNHAAIAQWREEQAIKRSVMHHFDWVRSTEMTDKQVKRVHEHIPTHYAALLHEHVMVKDGEVGTTSVTSFDIHDISRSSTTYGLEKYFIVTPLVDQQKVVKQLLDFWHVGVGAEYNKQRYEAVKSAELAISFDQVIESITKEEGQPPVIVGTSARVVDHKGLITYFDQEKVWKENRPVLFIFGTGKGLSREMIDRCDFLLGPVEGFTGFNHLSVRSAAAIIFDRWLGRNLKR